jgi:tetratricopeptide (TPR) repeat protein
MFLVSVLLWGCSTRKNTAISRKFHNLTSHYNIYFNANESVKEGLIKIDETVKDEYTRILPLFKYSNPEAANSARTEMELAILKGSKLVALHSITEKPKRKSNPSEKDIEFASKSEYNKWVDDTYMLMGQAYLYLHNYHRAIDNFSYLVRKFSAEPIKYDAYIWMAKTYITDERYQNAQEVFDILDSDPWLPQKQKKYLELNKAYFYINQNKYEEAIPYLEEALMYNFPREKEIRYTYVLAQLYAETDKPVYAEKRFREVMRRHPSFEMAFNARLNRASQITDNNDAENLKKQLKKMLRNKKYADFQDRIYYALGNVAMKEGQKQDALNFYKISAAKSTQNTDQRALSCLTLARSYYDDKEYINSQLYYDSTLAIIDNDYDGYLEISVRASSLGRLVENINIIELEDSLQRLALMPERDRNKLFKEWIKEAELAELIEREAEEAESGTSSYSRAVGRTFTNAMGKGKTWYFYNPTTVGIGQSDFRRIWGKRKLEDDWRRSNKATNTIDEPLEYLEEIETDTPEVAKKERSEDPKTVEYYTQDLPVTDSLMSLSNEKVLDAFFKLGRIYQSEFNDFKRSVETYEEMNTRFSKSTFELPSWYELYKLNKLLEKDERADYYKNKIITDYSGSKYANFLLNPNYFIELKASQDAINELYRKAFKNYRLRKYSETEKIAKSILAMNPDSTIVAKVKFLEIVSHGTSLGASDFSEILNSYIEDFPEAEPYELAVKIYDLVKDKSLNDVRNLLVSGYINGIIENKEIFDLERAENDDFDGKFSYEEDIFHYFVIALPKNVDTDINRLIFDLANYNLDYYSTIDFDIEKVELNKGSQMIVVRSLPNKEAGLIYFRSIIRQRPVFKTLKNVEYFNFVASSKNYREILANQDYREYLQFYMKNYSHFIGSDFPKNNLPDPMELLAIAQKEEEPVEKGEYVEVTPKLIGDYFTNMEEEHLYVLIPDDNKAEIRLIKTQYHNFNNYNTSKFNRYSLKVEEDSIGGKKALIVSGIPDGSIASEYFIDVEGTDDLFALLNNSGYNNFVISRLNYGILKNKNNVDVYKRFFENNYVKSSRTNESKTVDTPTIAPYQGPYNTGQGTNYSFVIIVPSDGPDFDKIKELFGEYNSENYGSPIIQTRVEDFDNEQKMLIVSGLDNKNSALTYFRKAISNRSLYSSIQNYSFRNFIISSENSKVFRNEKNLPEYIEFFRRFYLNK